MFKKSLAALAVLGVAAGYASAADVTLFGVVDTGLIYTHQTFADDSKADVNNFAMDSGVSSASRFGLKGTEELGNGLKVGFKLENGFQSDSGALRKAHLRPRSFRLPLLRLRYALHGPHGRRWLGCRHV